MSTLNLDSNNRFALNTAGVSDGTVVGPSLPVPADGSDAVIVLLNAGGAEVVMEIRRASDTAQANENNAGWTELGDTITKTQILHGKMIAGYEYRAVIKTAGTSPVSFEANELAGANRAYRNPSHDRDFGDELIEGFYDCGGSEITSVSASVIDFSTLSPDQCETLMSCILDNLNTSQIINLTNAIDFSQLDPTQCQAIISCVVDNITPAQAETLFGMFDFSNLSDAQCEAISECIEIDGSQVTIVDGGDNFNTNDLESVLQEIAMLLSGIAHTSISNIDLAATGANPNEYTVSIEWVDGDGVTHVTNDPTPITLSLAMFKFATLTAAQCVDIFDCILANGDPLQFTTLLNVFDFSDLTPAQCQAITDCVIENASVTQLNELINLFDFSMLTANQISNLQNVLGPLLTINAGSTASSSDNTNGEQPVSFGDIVHFWSNDGSIMFNISVGSAVVEASVNPTVLTGIAHTAITGIDLKPTANTNEFVVEINWTDGDGNAQVTTDPTPITVQTTPSIVSIDCYQDPASGTKFNVSTNEEGTQAAWDTSTNPPTETDITGGIPADWIPISCDDNATNINWAVSTQEPVTEVFDGIAPNTPITEMPTTFTPDAEGFYVIRHFAEVVRGTGIVYVGTAAGANDVFTSTDDRIDVTNRDKRYSFEVTAEMIGQPLHISFQAGGGSDMQNPAFEIYPVSERNEDENEVVNPVYLQFLDTFADSNTVALKPWVDEHGFGVKLQDINASNSFIEQEAANAFTVNEDTLVIRFEIRKETGNKNFYLDLRRISDNSLNRGNLNTTTGASTISSGSTSVIDNGYSWIVDFTYNTVAGEDYRMVLLPDFGAGQDCNVLYEYDVFATESIEDTNDVTEFLRTFSRINTTTKPVDTEYQGIPMTRLVDSVANSWSVYRYDNQIPQRGKVQFVRIIWRTDPAEARHAALRVGLTGIVIDTLFNIATGDVVEKNGGQTEVIYNEWLDADETIRETIIQYNTSRTDLTHWDLFPAYSNNNTTNSQAASVGDFDIAALDFNYDYQPEPRHVSRHKIVATAQNVSGQAAGNRAFIIESASTVETSPVVTDNGDNTYTVAAGSFPVEVKADFRTATLSNQVTSRNYYINNVADAVTDRMETAIDGVFGQFGVQKPAIAIIAPNTTVTVQVRSINSAGNQVLVEGSCLVFTELFELVGSVSENTADSDYRGIYGGGNDYNQHDLVHSGGRLHRALNDFTSTGGFSSADWETFDRQNGGQIFARPNNFSASILDNRTFTGYNYTGSGGTATISTDTIDAGDGNAEIMLIMNSGTGTLNIVAGAGMNYTGPASIGSGEAAYVVYINGTTTLAYKMGG